MSNNQFAAFGSDSDTKREAAEEAAGGAGGTGRAGGGGGGGAAAEEAAGGDEWINLTRRRGNARRSHMSSSFAAVGPPVIERVATIPDNIKDEYDEFHKYVQERLDNLFNKHTFIDVNNKLKIIEKKKRDTGWKYLKLTHEDIKDGANKKKNIYICFGERGFYIRYGECNRSTIGTLHLSFHYYHRLDDIEKIHIKDGDRKIDLILKKVDAAGGAADGAAGGAGGNGSEFRLEKREESEILTRVEQDLIKFGEAILNHHIRTAETRKAEKEAAEKAARFAEALAEADAEEKAAEKAADADNWSAQDDLSAPDNWEDENKYYLKYLKYKTKYLELKKKI